MTQVTCSWRAAASALCFGLAFVVTQGLAAVAAAATPAPKLTISYAQKTVDFLPILMADDAGYFNKHNLDIMVRYLPAQEGIPAVISGQVEGVGIGGSDAASAEAQGTKLKLVLTLTPVYPFQFWAQPKYASATKLKGQRVAITSTTGSLYAGTLLALKALGLKTTDVSVTPMGAVTSVNSALLAGSICGDGIAPAGDVQVQAGRPRRPGRFGEEAPAIGQCRALVHRLLHQGAPRRSTGRRRCGVAGAQP
jgi:NitT/TauT family transport system substrate-binding protein